MLNWLFGAFFATIALGAAHQLSPKASLIFTPLRAPQAGLELYVNYGHGFHSNDGRGAFATPRVSPLTRAIGAEVGARARLWQRWDLAAALWQLERSERAADEFLRLLVAGGDEHQHARERPHLDGLAAPAR